jgi:hypothetical protein
MTREEILGSLKEDYSQSYFVSGRGDMSAYAEVRIASICE